jgi:hypothetical protein
LISLVAGSAAISLIVSGQVRLVLGDEDLVLAPGGAAEFSTWTPRWISGVGAPAEALLLTGRHGERAHLRVSPGRGST